MNITPHVNPLPLQTAVNPPTDLLRRDNALREVITPVTATAQPAAEKSVASDRERAKGAGQNTEKIDFAGLQEQAEKEASTITDSSSQDKHEGSHNNNSQHEESAEEAESNAQVEAIEKIEASEIENLKDRDQEVRTHEAAHAAVGGTHAGSPSYSYEVGPDGKRYAVSGEVSIDVSPVSGDPQATIIKMQKVQAAALAPMNPSAQDIKVAATATQVIITAQSELLSPDETSNNTNYSANREVFNESGDESYEEFMNSTLSAQDKVVPRRDLEIDERAGRIENFYMKINQAYEKAPSSNFTISV